MRRHLWWLLGLALVLVGGVIALTAQAAPEDFGWLAYTPADTEPDWFMGSAINDSVLVVSREQLVGLALAALGLVALAAGAGFRLGRGRAAQQS